MKVVTYARVSTTGQERLGQSLPNQERAFLDFLDRTGHDRIRAYTESASAKSVTGRTQFTRMLADIERLKPDAIVVDTLDRFTRDLSDGLNLLKELRGYGVGLLPLDWRRADPINLDDDRDWADVVDEFTGAERERRRIGRRIRRSFEGRRERGATTTNRPPFGLRKVGDKLVPDEKNSWVILEAEQRFLAGEPYRQIVSWLGMVTDGAVTHRRSLRRIFANNSYVAAGLRSPEVQQNLRQRLDFDATRYGKVSNCDHPLTGVIACGRCVAGGRDPQDSLMHGSWQPTNGCKALICKERGHRYFYVSNHRVEPLFEQFLERWKAPAVLERWARTDDRDATNKAATLRSRLAAVETEATKLMGRRHAALDAAPKVGKTVLPQLEKALREIELAERSLNVQRQAIAAEIAETSAPPRMDPGDLAGLLDTAVETYRALRDRDRNELARSLCLALGSHPRLNREGRRYGEVTLSWPELAAFEVPNIADRRVCVPEQPPRVTLRSVKAPR